MGFKKKVYVVNESGLKQDVAYNKEELEKMNLLHVPDSTLNKDLDAKKEEVPLELSSELGGNNSEAEEVEDGNKKEIAKIKSEPTKKKEIKVLDSKKKEDKKTTKKSSKKQKK